MKIEFVSFSGELPRVLPRLLPPENPVETSNARLNRGGLEPIRKSITVGALAAPAAGFKLHDGVFIPLGENSDAVAGPVAESRLYITHGADAAPQIYFEGAYYPLAIPAPEDEPSLTLTGSVDPELAESVLYAFTWVTDLGEESALSPISSPLDWSPACTVSVNMSTSTPPAGRMVVYRRLYRSATSAAGITDMFFVADVEIGVTTFVHDIGDHPLAEAIASRDYDTPPDDLKGIVALPNGIMAAFVGRRLYFCEPYMPHAWPEKYSLLVSSEIVGLAAFGSTLAVLTVASPYIVQGLHPDSMAMERMEVAAPCVSRRGIVDTGYSAVFPSTDGLVEVSQSGAQIISKMLWTREQWQKTITPSTIRAGVYEGRYVFSYRPGGVGDRKICAIALDGDGSSVIPVDDDPVLFFSTHVETGRLLALSDVDDVSVRSFDDPDGELKTYVWRSKPFKMPTPVTMGVVYIEAEPPEDADPRLEVKVTAGATPLDSVFIPNAITRLPPALSDLWQIEVIGNYRVTRVILAGSPDEVWQ